MTQQACRGNCMHRPRIKNCVAAAACSVAACRAAVGFEKRGGRHGAGLYIAWRAFVGSFQIGTARGGEQRQVCPRGGSSARSPYLERPPFEAKPCGTRALLSGTRGSDSSVTTAWARLYPWTECARLFQSGKYPAAAAWERGHVDTTDFFFSPSSPQFM